MRTKDTHTPQTHMFTYTNTTINKPTHLGNQPRERAVLVPQQQPAQAAARADPALRARAQIFQVLFLL